MHPSNVSSGCAELAVPRLAAGILVFNVSDSHGRLTLHAQSRRPYKNICEPESLKRGLRV